VDTSRPRRVENPPICRNEPNRPPKLPRSCVGRALSVTSAGHQGEGEHPPTLDARRKAGAACSQVAQALARDKALLALSQKAPAPGLPGADAAPPPPGSPAQPPSILDKFSGRQSSSDWTHRGSAGRRVAPSSTAPASPAREDLVSTADSRPSGAASPPGPGIVPRRRGESDLVGPSSAPAGRAGVVLAIEGRRRQASDAGTLLISGPAVAYRTGHRWGGAAAPLGGGDVHALAGPSRSGSQEAVERRVAPDSPATLVAVPVTPSPPPSGLETAPTGEQAGGGRGPRVSPDGGSMDVERSRNRLSVVPGLSASPHDPPGAAGGPDPSDAVPSLVEACASRIARDLGAFARGGVQGLPDDMITVVFEHAVVAGTVDTARLPLFRSPHGLPELRLRNYPGVTDDWVGQLVGPSTVHVDLAGCPGVTDAGLEALDRSPRLLTLDLSGCPGVTGAGVARLAQRATRLRSVALRGCPGVTGDAVEALGRHAGGLRELDLSRCRGLLGSTRALAGLAALTELEGLSLGWAGGGGQAVGSSDMPELSVLAGLTRLDLSGSLIDAGDLEALSGADALECLALDGCRQLDQGWGARPEGTGGLEALARLPRLRALSLRGSRVDPRDVAEAVSKCAGLASLCLAGVPLTVGASLALGAVGSLTDLDLENTGLTDRGCTALAVLKGLRRLNLSDNRVSANGAAALASLRGLEDLDLGHTDVSDLGCQHLSGLTGLTRLCLDCPDVTDEGVRCLRDLRGLSDLDLFGCRVHDTTLALLCGRLAGLTRLEACGGSLTDAVAFSLPKLRRLRVLSLAQNFRLTGRVCSALAEVPTLHRVNLANTGVDDAGLRALAGLPELVCVSAVNTRVTGRGAEELQAAAPCLAKVAY